jgi:cell wall-associated NlpC family hydrolase
VTACVHRTRSRVAAGVVVLAAAVTTLAPVSTASADPVADARARAAAIAQSVDRLQTAAEVATERYDAAEAQLGDAVTERLLAEQAAEAQQTQVEAAQAQVGDRVRALYESGGQASLVATVLAGNSPTDALAGLHVVGQLLSADQADVAQAHTAAQAAARLATRLRIAADHVTQLQHQAAQSAMQVRTLLARQRAALASANADVRRLVAEQQAAAAAASARDFQSAVEAAGGHIDGSMTPTNPTAAAAIAAARSRLGDPYVWGATGPNSFDCSGLTQWSYAHAGVMLPRVAADQYNVGRHVALADLQPGDLLFWATDLSNPATIHHVAMYIGGGMMSAAPNTGDVVKVEAVYMDGFIGATRPY